MNKITKVGNHLNLEHGIKVILLELKNIPKKPGIYKMINSFRRTNIYWKS